MATCDVITRRIQYACLLLFILPVRTLQDTALRTKIARQILDPETYDKRIRPDDVNSNQTVVNMTLNLVSVIDLDSISETLETSGWLSITWYDYRLSWTNNGIDLDDDLTIPQDEIWRPDIALKNSKERYRPVGNKYLYVTIQDGLINWEPYEVFFSNCDLNMKNFPFDVQTCELIIGPWSFVSKEMKIKGGDLNMNAFESNSQFRIKNGGFEIREKSGGYVAVFKIELTRKPLFIIMTTVIPIIMLGILNICVFILPFNSGEKISYAVTVLLAFMVTLTYVSTILPDNSDSISLLAVYILCQSVQSSIQTIVVIILCSVNDFAKEGQPIPRGLSCLSTTLCCSRRRHYEDTNQANDFKLQNCPQDTNNIGQDSEQDVANKKKDLAIAWADVIKGLDRLCLIIFSLLFAVVTAVYFILSVLNLA